MGCHALLQRIFPTQWSNPCLLCLVSWQVGSLPLTLPGKPETLIESNSFSQTHHSFIYLFIQKYAEHLLCAPPLLGTQNTMHLIGTMAQFRYTSKFLTYTNMSALETSLWARFHCHEYLGQISNLLNVTKLVSGSSGIWTIQSSCRLSALIHQAILPKDLPYRFQQYLCCSNELY